MFPQLGAPVGFFFSGGVFLLLSTYLTDDQFFSFGWRIPFLASAVLVLVGLYVRLTITPTGNNSGAAPLCAIALLGNPQMKPVTQATA